MPDSRSRRRALEAMRANAQGCQAVRLNARKRGDERPAELLDEQTQPGGSPAELKHQSRCQTRVPLPPPGLHSPRTSRATRHAPATYSSMSAAPSGRKRTAVRGMGPCARQAKSRSVAARHDVMGSSPASDADILGATAASGGLPSTRSPTMTSVSTPRTISATPRLPLSAPCRGCNRSAELVRRERAAGKPLVAQLDVRNSSAGLHDVSAALRRARRQDSVITLCGQELGVREVKGSWARRALRASLDPCAMFSLEALALVVARGSCPAPNERIRSRPSW